MTEEFPRRISDVSTSWLTAALGETITAFDVENIGVGKGMMGDIYRLHVSDASGRKRSVVAKFSAEREELRAAAKRAGIFEREVNFYRHLGPVLKCRIPECFGSWFDPTTAEFAILMESIAADPTVSQVSGVSLEQAMAVMRELAALHVPESDVRQFSSFIMPASSDARRTNQTNFVMNGWEKLREIIPTNSGFAHSPTHMADRLITAIDVLASQPRFLLHGDARPDNLLFLTNSSEVALIDWQGLMFGPREWDLGYFLAQGLRTEDRRLWTDSLVAHYVEMSSLAGKQIDLDGFMTNIGRAAWFSFGVACSLFTVADTSLSQTIELAASMGERSLSLLCDFGEL